MPGDVTHEEPKRMNEQAVNALEAYRSKVATGEIEPAARLNPWQKWEQKDSRSTAIAAKCWECMCGDRSAIKECTSGPQSDVPCPLWNWRPYK